MAERHTTDDSGRQSTEQVVARWFDALRRGDGPAALDCLADDIVWENNPPLPEFDGVIPWLGIFRSRDEVIESFRVWGNLSQVEQFELLDTFIKDDEALGIVHEVALIKPTQLRYDIEFIQRIQVAGGKIVRWKSYWDTTRGLAAFGARLERPAAGGA
jgi:ketosteroid isomerase-like protein